MRKLFVFWFGGKMSKNRKLALSSICKNSGVKIELITEKNVYDYSITNDPIHLGFKYLSSTHKSAYLRPYVMKHYGGGYTDIKIMEFDWNLYFEILERSDKDFIGYPEIGACGVSYKIPVIQAQWQQLCGCGHYIFKPRTKFAYNWYDKVKHKMDAVYNQLKLNPGTYHPRAIPGGYIDDNNTKVLDLNKYNNYPLDWGTEFGTLLHTTMYENIDRYIIQMPVINGHFTNIPYR
jgi:hypothetical protein